MEEKITFKSERDMPPLAVSLGTMRQNKTGTWRSVKPVIDYSSCIRCMICWKYCPDDAIKIDRRGKKEAPKERFVKEPVPVIDYDYCKGCGICAEECPKKCISLVGEEK